MTEQENLEQGAETQSADEYVNQLIQEASEQTAATEKKVKERKPKIPKEPKAERPRKEKPQPEPLYIVKKDEQGQPVFDENGAPVMELYVKPTVQRKPREPKLVPQLDAEGNPVLGEDGQPVMVPAPKAARAGAVIPQSERAVIHVTEEQAAKLKAYKGDRGAYAAAIVDGMQIGDYLLAGGDRGFLRFYVRDGACTVSDAGPIES